MAAKKLKQLVFAPHGGVTLLRGDTELWSSDKDDAFIEQFEDVIDPNSEEEIDDLAAYLVDKNLLDDEEDFDVIEEYLDDTATVRGPGDDEDDEDDENYDD